MHRGREEAKGGLKGLQGDEEREREAAACTYMVSQNYFFDGKAFDELGNSERNCLSNIDRRILKNVPFKHSKLYLITSKLRDAGSQSVDSSQVTWNFKISSERRERLTFHFLICRNDRSVTLRSFSKAERIASRGAP